ncbi:PKD domain-containing protein [Halobacterium bonnevillei]|uniref:PKD domain-containing protein n=1 Tax=Halobacterium bonnevillei TaxID=2692200 RepID=A0A6B0SCQ2_9EURY|nr:PKD domain-containing protein [Halobacterium bonnevillei]MXR19148.1 PKD domain-containing protein [Halobacterium bonnevillei]
MTRHWQTIGAVMFAIILIAAPVSGAATTPSVITTNTQVQDPSLQTDTNATDDDPPDAPESYYGNVTIDGQPAPAGTVITALIDGEVKGQITVDTPGSYGGPKVSDEKLVVNASENGSTVRFFVGSLEANTTDEFQSGTNSELDLAFDDTESPTANAGSNYQTLENEPVTFDGSESTDDGQLITYEWDFGDNTENATGVSPTHEYSENGTYTVTLTVTDAAGKTDTDTATVTVGAVENPPEADFTATPTNPEAGQEITFENQSTDNGTIERVEWDFDGDGETDAEGDTVTHRFGVPRTYNVTLTVTDDSGFQDTHAKRITVSQTERDLAASPTTGYVNATTVDFELPNTDNLHVDEYEWHFDDGTPLDSTSSPTTAHVYNQDGAFNVTVTGYNNGTTVVTGNETVTVETVSGTLDSSQTQAVVNWTTLDLSAEASEPVNQSALTYEWDFGNGQTETTDANETSYVYPSAENFTITVTARGDGGPVFTDTIDISVERAKGSLSASPDTAYTNVTAVNYTATTDTDGITPTAYEWDFDGDGVFERTTTSNEAAHVFTQSGSFTSTVSVKSQHGRLFKAETPVTVQQPAGDLTATPTSGFANSTTVSLELANVSESVRSNIDHYQWDFGDGTTRETASNSTTRVYAETGEHEVIAYGIDSDSDIIVSAVTTVTIERATGQVTTEPAPIRANVTEMNATVTDVTPEVSDDIEHYEWAFGDGTTETTTSNATTHTYSQSGSYTLTATAVTNTGDVLFDTQTTIDVLEEGRPTAAFTWTPTQPTVGETVTFNASASTDNDPLASYEWDFDSDGTTDDKGETTQHTFTEFVGERNVTLTVTDQDGLTESTQHTVTVVRANGDLVADPTTGYANYTAIGFQLTNVTADIDAAEYEWTFGDGNNITTIGNTTTFTYTEPGDYEATVTALNDQGETLVVESETVSITRASGDATATPNDPYANWTDVNFEVENVTPGVTPAAYEWDFGNGDSDVTSSNATTYTYSQPGEYEATVTALSSDETVLFTRTITISVQRADGELAASPSPALTNVTEVTLTATTTSPGVDPVAYQWSFGDGSTRVTTANTTTHLYSSAGNYTTEVRALNGDGQPLFTRTATVEVVDGDISVSINTPAEQRIQDGVLMNVTVTNERGIKTPGVNVSVEAQGDYYYTRDEQTSATLGPVTLNASESKTLTWNITTWADQELDPSSYYNGRIDLRATADPGDEIPEANERNNRDAADTVATFTDIETYVYSYYRGVIGDQHEVDVTIENEGSAGAKQPHNVTVSMGDGTTKEINLSAAELGAGERNYQTIEYTYSERGDYQINATVLTDPQYPENNRSTDSVRIRPFELSMDYVNAPYEVENGSTFTVYGSYDTNTETEVNLSIELPDGLELADGESRTKTDQSSRWGGSERWTVKATTPSDDYQINVTATARNESETNSDTTTVIIPKIRVTDEAAAVVSGGDSNSSTGELIVRNESTFDHEITLSVQAGFEGRTLEGLEYLFSYPYGCVEQTTSPMLAALHTDQYYRDRISPGDYDRDRVNKSVAIGMERLSSGDNAQHDNGAWSMWGNSPSGDRFYTMYALFGSASVRNDEAYGTNSGTASTASAVSPYAQDISTSIDAIDYNQTIHWIRDIQTDDGAIESDGYFLDDDPAMTGYTLVTIEKAEPFNESTQSVATAVRRNATQYLLETQEDNGSWNDDNAKSTAIAVWGLQTAVESGLDNQTLSTRANESIDDGVEYLLQTQAPTGKWVEDRSSYWSSTGTTSQATAYALLALNSTGYTADNRTIQKGGEYLVGVYDDEGSWGFTEATAISIRALQEIGQGLGTVDRTVTIDINYENGTTALTKEVTVNESNSVARISLTADERKKLRQGSVTKTVTVNATGTGTVVTAIRNEQLVNREEYEDTEQARSGTSQSLATLESTALDTGGNSIGTQAPPFSVSVASDDELSARNDQTMAVTVTNNGESNMLSPIVEIPIRGGFNASATLDATAYAGTETVSENRLGTRLSEVNTSTLTDGDSIYVFARDVPAGSSRTYTVDVDVGSPGDIDVTADIRPMYNESFNVRTSQTLTATGLGDVNIDVVDEQASPVAADISIDGTQVATNTASTSTELSTGDHEISVVSGDTARSLNVSLANFETANVTFVQPDTVTEPMVVARTGDEMAVKSGTPARIVEQTANATAAEEIRRTFDIASSGGTMIVAFNETTERAVQAGAEPSITVDGADTSNWTYTAGENGGPSTIKIKSDGDVQVNITYDGKKLGEVTGDNSVTADDAAAIADAIANNEAVSSYGDVNNDGEVTVVDAMMIAQYADGARDADYQEGDA